MRRPRRWPAVLLLALAACALGAAGCAKYNTYFNAKRAFDDAEHEREEKRKQGLDVSEVSGAQRNNYDTAVKKCQKILDEYPGSGLTDDALFLMAKSYHRMKSYRMSIRKLELLFANFPATDYEEEALYFQALNYMLVGDVTTSNELLALLRKNYPDSRFQAEASRVGGEASFVLENWEEARDSFREYLAQKDLEPRERDRIALMLAETHVKLHEHAEAAEVLRQLAATTPSLELAFDARLLLARSLIQLGQHDEARELLEDLRGEAETFSADGAVSVAEAENLVAEGRDDEAAVILENMPEEWLTDREVMARRHDVLGRLYYRRWDLEQARTELREAVKGGKVLDDLDETRLMMTNISEFMAAEQSLVDARPQRVPSLKLLQANALLIGLQKPRLALERFLEAADAAAAQDTLLEAGATADTTSGPRALFGAWITLRDHLDRPDSAAIVAARLQDEYPASPQAYLLAPGREHDLLRYLLDQQEASRERQLAAAAADTARTATPAAAVTPAPAPTDTVPPAPAIADSVPDGALPGPAVTDAVPDTVPPAPAVADTIPQTPAVADTIPQTPATADTVPPAPAVADTVPQASAPADTVPQAPATAVPDTASPPPAGGGGS